MVDVSVTSCVIVVKMPYCEKLLSLGKMGKIGRKLDMRLPISNSGLECKNFFK